MSYFSAREVPEKVFFFYAGTVLGSLPQALNAVRNYGFYLEFARNPRHWAGRVHNNNLNRLSKNNSSKLKSFFTTEYGFCISWFNRQ